MRKILKYEYEFQKAGYDFVIGIDEAGRGPLAGPVTAAAVAWRKFQIPNDKFQTISNFQIQNSKQLNLIRDSKALSEGQREKLYDFIVENFHVGVGICDHKTVDRINILEATYLAMKSAVTQIVSSIKYDVSSMRKGRMIRDASCIILVDGNKVIPNLSMEQKAIVGGDNLVKSISAASIIAKVTRDRLMREYHEKYPLYGFDRHKGYGTRHHFEMLEKHGVCEIHRKSFRLV